jgi:hypothetical protein
VAVDAGIIGIAVVDFCTVEVVANVNFVVLVAVDP